ncbi:MAG: hypothetical protein ACK452_15125 [Bacteroidota bacterium]|jgi:TM2 domain-containing membrane protein YozV
MKNILSLLFLFLFFRAFPEKAACKTMMRIDTCSFNLSTEQKPNILHKIFKKRVRHTKRAMAAVLAFPLPFGVLALHRIYLGTAAHVPVVYIGTVGGVFGILPFIDFCILALDRKVDRFQNNGRIFMWIEQESNSE